MKVLQGQQAVKKLGARGAPQSEAKVKEKGCLQACKGPPNTQPVSRQLTSWKDNPSLQRRNSSKTFPEPTHMILTN